MIIYENGSHKINGETIGSKASTVMVSGVSGGGTLTLTYSNALGDQVPLVDGVIAVGEQVKVAHGSGTALFATLAGSTGAKLAVEVAAA